MEITIIDLLKNFDKKKDKPIVFCGHCGAIEVYISETKTECPNCDITGLEKSHHKRYL